MFLIWDLLPFTIEAPIIMEPAVIIGANSKLFDDRIIMPDLIYMCPEDNPPRLNIALTLLQFAILCTL